MILLSLSQKRVCISDEKWLVLHPSPNWQTDRIWALWDPEEELCWFQGDLNVMAWVTLVNGRPLTEVDGGRARSPSVHQRRAISLNAARRSWAKNAHMSRKTTALVDTRWRNGAHNRCGPQFPRQKVLRSEINWQPCSPDLNPLDFSCCSFATIHVYCQSHKALTS